MLAETARWHGTRAREEVCACHAGKFLGRKQVNACILCTNVCTNIYKMLSARVPETCMLSDQGIFAEVMGFMETAPKKYCLVCPEKSRNRLSGLTNAVC
jgi:hypothetical protein